MYRFTVSFSAYVGPNYLERPTVTRFVWDKVH